MTLKEFQNSNGIEFRENICLVHNRERFPGRAHYCIERFDPNPKSENVIRKEVNGNVFSISKSEQVLFYGQTSGGFNFAYLPHVFRMIEGSNQKYIMICGKSDFELTKDLLDRMPANIVGIYANNLNVRNDRAFFFPMGRDFRSHHLLPLYHPQPERSILAYCNFSLIYVRRGNLLPPVKERDRTYELLKDKRFIKVEHMGQWEEYSISKNAFFEQLSQSKFSICPRGRAIDTHRLWDSLYLGVIPIVVREALFHEELLDLPILFIEDIEDYGNLTPDFLEDKYEEMLRKDWNYEKLKLSYWMSRIKRLAASHDIKEDLC